jgi:hypothetical protein
MNPQGIRLLMKCVSIALALFISTLLRPEPATIDLYEITSLAPALKHPSRRESKRLDKTKEKYSSSQTLTATSLSFTRF